MPVSTARQDPATAPVLTLAPLAGAGIAHGFSTRRTGVPRDGQLESALPAFFAAGGFPPESAHVSLRQVHGAQVHLAHAPCAPADAPVADGVVSRTPGLVLLLRTADCVPVLLADPEAGVVGAAHAGWRGAVAGVVTATVDAMRGLGAHPERMVAAVGAAIGPCCFAVNDDIAAQFSRLNPGLVHASADQPMVNLPAAVSHQLHAAGIPEAAIGQVPHCTRCRRDHFYSHRGEDGQAGRLLSAIAAR